MVKVIKLAMVMGCDFNHGGSMSQVVAVEFYVIRWTNNTNFIKISNILMMKISLAYGAFGPLPPIPSLGGGGK